MFNHSGRTLRGLLLAAAVAASLAPSPSSALEVTTNAAVRHQTVEGWGASGGASTMNNNAWRQAYRDLGLNIYRLGLSHQALTPARTDYNGNGQLEPNEADYRVRVPLLGNTPEQNAAKFNFSLDSGEQRSGVFAAWLAVNALEPERTRIVGSLWTPPHWMKGPTGATQNFVGITANYATPWMAGSAAEVTWLPDGQGDSIGGRLRTEDANNLAEYGLYIAAHVKAFQQTFGVDLHAISLQNESTFENPFISMVLNRGPKPASGNSPTDYGQYNLALKSVRDAWAAYGLTTNIKGPHVAQVGPTPDNPWSLLMQMSYINAVRNDADPTLIDFIDYYNSNYYMPTSEAGAQATAGYYLGRGAVTAPWATWLSPSVANGVKQDGKPIWYSEAGSQSNSWLASPGTPGNGAIAVALSMHNALVHSDAAAYIYWQFTDGNNASATEHSLVGASQLADPTQSAKYAAFKHFSRYVRPGAVRIDAAFENGEASTSGASKYDAEHAVSVSAFLHEEDRTLTYVLLNLTNAEQPITLHLPDGVAVNDFSDFRSTETERFTQLADLAVAEGQVEFSMPSFSLVTLVGELPATPGDFNGDGAVDGADLDQWRDDYAVSAGSDADNDGETDGADFLVWQRALTGSPPALEIPEPQSLIQAAAALVTYALGVSPALRRDVMR